MGEKIVLVVVMAIIIVAHVWLYHWVKFKMDEGVVVNALKELFEAGEYDFLSIDAIASSADMALDRVCLVCTKSKKIQGHTSEDYLWRLG